MTDLAARLKPCPFCGKALHLEFDDYDPETIEAYCRTEDCLLGPELGMVAEFGPNDTEDRVKQWNRRAENGRLDDA